MASNKRALAECDTCGFQYPHRTLKMNSYGMLVCPTDWDGAYDLKNHPQNYSPDVSDNPTIMDPRPPAYTERNLTWETATLNWEDASKNWNNI